MLMKTTQSMLHFQIVELDVWKETTSTTLYSTNLSPHKIYYEIAPEEAYQGKKPLVLDLYICYIWIFQYSFST